jgi:hypothetical protein
MDWKSSIVILYKGCLNEAIFLGSVIEEVEEELQILLIHAARPPWTHAATLQAQTTSLCEFTCSSPFLIDDLLN